MSNISADVVKDLGIYGIKATITLNAGAFGVILSNTEHLNNIKLILWFFWLGLLFAAAAIFITYCIAQKSSAGSIPTNFKKHMALMTIPTACSFLLFLTGTAIAVMSY